MTDSKLKNHPEQFKMPAVGERLNNEERSRRIAGYYGYEDAMDGERANSRSRPDSAWHQWYMDGYSAGVQAGGGVKRTLSDACCAHYAGLGAAGFSSDLKEQYQPAKRGQHD